MKILIADADPDATALLRQKLEESPKVQIKEATCGIDALKILTTFREGFDAAIVDLALPDIDGIDFLTRLRRLPALRSIPVVVCTSIRDRATVTSSLGLGVRHYVIKPAHPDLIHARLLDAMAVASA